MWFIFLFQWTNAAQSRRWLIREEHFVIKVYNHTGKRLNLLGWCRSTMTFVPFVTMNVLMMSSSRSWEIIWSTKELICFSGFEILFMAKVSSETAPWGALWPLWTAGDPLMIILFKVAIKLKLWCTNECKDCWKWKKVGWGLVSVWYVLVIHSFLWDFKTWTFQVWHFI